MTLDGTWNLREGSLTGGLEDAARLMTEETGWIEQPVPGDIHQGLIAAGKIQEPLVGMNSFDCSWTEERAWWFRRDFVCPAGTDPGNPTELVLNGLDSNAEIFLNGVHLGGHRSSFHPFVRRVEQHLRPGAQNTLLVRLSAGVENVTEEDLRELFPNPVGVRVRPERDDRRRVFVRKPQFSFGWDWSPRVPTTAIAGETSLVFHDTVAVRDVRVRPEKKGGDVILHVTVTAEFFHHYKTRAATATVRVTGPDGSKFEARSPVLLRSGLTHIELPVRVRNARLWWPAGAGGQDLYTIEAGLESGEKKAGWPAFTYGIRFVELDTEGTFALRINGKKIFGKGANWIPADAIYARVTADDYDRLVRDAREANFTMLRVWGGGLYEPEAFYRACDRQGIMVWQDFMFACAPYPDHRECFREEVRREADYQTKRLRNHPSVVLWCGNNECSQLLARGHTDKGAYLYNHLLPEVVRCNCPEVPYWNGSPYGGETTNDETVGDRHHWKDCMMHQDMSRRIRPEGFDECAALFVSEYGYIGAPVKKTVLEYLGTEAPDTAGPAWLHHTNTFEKGTVSEGIRKHYIDPEGLSFDDYLLYSGLCQGLMYGYSLDSFRGRPTCNGALFWMYEDCWGEIGWTILDYSRRRKIAWYFVRRALAPVRLVMREKRGLVAVTMANDSPIRVSGTLSFDAVPLDGSPGTREEKEFACPPFSRKVLGRFRKGDADVTKTLWTARVKGDPDILPAWLRATDFRKLLLTRPSLELSIAGPQDSRWQVTVRSDRFAHAVHLLLPDGAVADDDYFDLLPGQERRVAVGYPGDLHAGDVGVRSVYPGYRIGTGA